LRSVAFILAGASGKDGTGKSANLLDRWGSKNSAGAPFGTRRTGPHLKRRRRGDVAYTGELIKRVTGKGRPPSPEKKKNT